MLMLMYPLTLGEGTVFGSRLSNLDKCPLWELGAPPQELGVPTLEPKCPTTLLFLLFETDLSHFLPLAIL